MQSGDDTGMVTCIHINLCCSKDGMTIEGTRGTCGHPSWRQGSFKRIVIAFLSQDSVWYIPSIFIIHEFIIYLISFLRIWLFSVLLAIISSFFSVQSVPFSKGALLLWVIWDVVSQSMNICNLDIVVKVTYDKVITLYPFAWNVQMDHSYLH